MVAALTAAEQGLEVVLLEKTPWVMGNTAASGGMIPAAGTRFQRENGIFETPEEMAIDIFEKNGYESDPDITLALCKRSKELVEWMADDLGIQFELVTEFSYPGHSNLRMHAPPSRAGADLIKQLKLAVNKRNNIYLLLEANVQGLITNDNGEVCGVDVQTKSGGEKIGGKKVILACNGFGGNREMVKQYIPEMADALYFGYEANTGDGIRWGMELGAATENMRGFQGHASVAVPHGILVTWGTVMNGGFLVNRTARRFGNETEGYSEYALEELKQPDGIAYVIFDRRILESIQKIDDVKKSMRTGAVKEGESIEELARRFELNPDALRETLDEFNQTAVNGKDAFGRTIFGERLTPPFYGVQVTGALFHTQGGLKVNVHAQVLDQRGIPIPNLYAGGGTAAGVSGNSPQGYMSGNGLLSALGFGRIAGEHAALQILQANKQTDNGNGEVSK